MSYQHRSTSKGVFTLSDYQQQPYSKNSSRVRMKGRPIMLPSVGPMTNIVSQEEDHLRQLFQATITSEMNITWDPNLVMQRYNSLADTEAYKKFNLNREQLVGKITKLRGLEYFMNRDHPNEPIIPWVDSWFERITFSDQSIIHSMPANLIAVAKVTHSIILLYAINNKNVIIHGSFGAHLRNPSIRYSDIDLTCLLDELIYITSFLLYLFLGLETHILSIPYVINHRSLRINQHDTSICDAIKMDSNTLMAQQPTSLQFRRGIYLNLQNPVVQFFNYFKMLAVDERRRKMRHYKANQKLILSTIVSSMMEHTGLTHNTINRRTIMPYTVLPFLEANDVIHMKLMYGDHQKDVYFYSGLRDHDFFPVVMDLLIHSPAAQADPDRSYLQYSQLGSVFPEQRIDVISRSRGLGSETHINISRNDIYRIVSTLDVGAEELPQISDISILTLLGVYGLHAFFARTYKEHSVEDFVRVIVTIIDQCNQMTSQSITRMYGRTKNNGPHEVRTIRSRSLRIPSANHRDFAALYTYDYQRQKLIRNKGFDIQGYIEYTQQLAEIGRLTRT